MNGSGGTLNLINGAMGQSGGEVLTKGDNLLGLSTNSAINTLVCLVGLGFLAMCCLVGVGLCLKFKYDKKSEDQAEMDQKVQNYHKAVWEGQNGQLLTEMRAVKEATTKKHTKIEPISDDSNDSYSVYSEI